VAPLTAAELAARVGGTLLGDGTARVAAVATLDGAGPDDVSFLASRKYAAAFHASRAGVVFVTEPAADLRPGPAVRIVVQDPQRAMLQAIGLLHPTPPRPVGVEPTAVIEPGAALGADCYVGHHAVLRREARLGDRTVVLAGAVVGEGASIGSDTTLHEHVVLYPRTVVGDRVILHAGVRLGCDGFGYVPGKEGHAKIPHVGRCVIGDDVEIGANTTVDRGSVGDTTIGPGTKIDNLVQVGHNCRIGARCFLMAQVGLAGSTIVEDDCILAGQVGVSGHLTIGRGARIAAQSGVAGSVPAGETWGGYVARPHREWLRAEAAMYELAPLARQLEALVHRDSQG
jgi:UDP-3-O-[3-hydroxymyristoyl] glucosamine N-acyltransferase